MAMYGDDDDVDFPISKKKKTNKIKMMIDEWTIYM